ncbi:hypothetical protein SMICM17S_03909 [Streptomyces microflavus]
MTSRRVSPSEKAASLSRSGTAARESTLTATMVGMIMTARTMPAASRLSPPGTSAMLPTNGRMSRIPISPYTIEGTAASSSTLIRRARAVRPGTYSESATAAPQPTGTARTSAMTHTTAEP